MSNGLGRIVEGLEQAGLATHEVEVKVQASRLGVCWDGQRHCTALTDKRFWRVTQATRFALSWRALPGWMWELLLGHLTFCGLVRRDILSGLHAIYTFVRRHYTARVPLWKTAREEFTHYLSGLFFMRADWTLQWDRRVVCTDASPIWPRRL